MTFSVTRSIYDLERLAGNFVVLRIFPGSNPLLNNILKIEGLVFAYIDRFPINLGIGERGYRIYRLVKSGRYRFYSLTILTRSVIRDCWQLQIRYVSRRELNRLYYSIYFEEGGMENMERETSLRFIQSHLKCNIFA